MDASTDPDAPLTAVQQQALDQLRDLTNGADDDVAAGVLRAVDWDVQRAAELIFGSGAPPPPPTAPAPAPPRQPTFEPLEIDDTLQGHGAGPAPRRPAHPASTLLTLARPLLTLLSIPLHILAALARLLLTALRLPVPTFPFPALRFAGLSFYRSGRWGLGGSGGSGRMGGSGGGSGGGGGRNAQERWVRELEEETGALARGAAAPSGVGTGASTSLAGGGSAGGLVARAGGGNGSSASGNGGSGDDDAQRRVLPAFLLCTYEEFLRTCARDARIGCVVLVSAEHDAVAAFKRTTLVDPSFVRLLDEHDILVWGGDVRESDAWSAAEKLQATTYPFVAFLALQPSRAPSSSLRSTAAAPSSSSQHTLTVLSRHQGPSTPSSPTPSSSALGPTSASTLSTHLTTQLLPRVAPFLARITAAQRERERDRELRAEQDRAFQHAAARDKARIEAALEAERAAARRAAEAARVEAEARKRAEKEAVEAERRKEERVAWRRWTRRAIVGSLSDTPTGASGGGAGGGGLRLAVRLPTGARLVRAFDSTATLTTLYAVVDAALLPAELSPADDPVSPPTTPTQPKHAAAALTSPDAERVLEAHILSSISSHTHTPSTSTSTTSTSSTTPSTHAPSTPAPPSTNTKGSTYPTQEEGKNTYFTQEEGKNTYFPFLIATAYPRSELRWSPHTLLADVGALRGGGQVVVELLLGRDDGRSGAAKSRAGAKEKAKANASSPKPKAGLSKVGGGAGMQGGGAEEEYEEEEDSDDGYATEESE